MINLENNIIDIELFKRVLREIKNSDRTDIIDSFSDNQFKSKIQLVKMIEDCNILDVDSQISIFGCWYGSIILPLLSPKARKIIMLDIDDKAIRIGKNKFFPNYENVSWSTGDVFTKWRGDFIDTSLFINTSCEHMSPMKDWPYWQEINKPVYFAFQSNNMYDIDTHINCVSSLQEFKDQMPKDSVIINEHALEEERGIRFTVIGKLCN